MTAPDGDSAGSKPGMGPRMEPRPRWICEIERQLPIRSQFVVSGQIRDCFPWPVPDGQGEVELLPLLRYLWENLRPLGYRLLLVYDPVDGIRPYPNEPEILSLAGRLFDLKLRNGALPIGLGPLTETLRRIAGCEEVRCGLVIDFASRIPRNTAYLDGEEHRFFVAAELQSLAAFPVQPRDPGGKPAFNPILWLLNRPQDLPSWYALDSNRVALITIAPPDYEVRRRAALSLSHRFVGGDGSDAVARGRFATRFADGTDGQPLTALAAIAVLAVRQGIGIEAVEDAIRCFKVGAVADPWKKPYLREKIAQAAVVIGERVRGQPQAIAKTVDILMRSAMGLTGAQARSGANRPRGVLFFAGPTGVGKTELAKALTQLLFGDEGAYLRFDMSEFAEEHSSARLLGAPPGYVGYDAGGELTNAMREKPFRVVLFDEIEKAHPRILDKFLQILEDGRLTDGQGDTVYFSEAIVVFTSNLGIFMDDGHGGRIQNVQPGDPYEQVEMRIRTAIQDYFKYQLARPEILNRIGDNIVVFDFIGPAAAEQILAGMLGNVIARVKEGHGLELVLAEAVRARLLALCTQDLANGGRGIGNRLESLFINPLSRTLFSTALAGRQAVSVVDLREDENRIVTLTIE